MDQRILLVDDNYLGAMTLSEAFNSLGVKSVEIANDLHTAMEKVSERDWHYVVVDFQLGNDDAVELIQLLVEQEIPHSVITGFPAHTLPLSLNDTDVVQKPVTLDFVRKVVNCLI